MLKGKTVAVVVPAYNEEDQIGLVIESMPDFVDRIIIVNDCSTDNTKEKVIGYIKADSDNATEITHRSEKIDYKNPYNRAEFILLEQDKRDEKYFAPSEIYNKNPESDRIVLISHLNNAKKGSAVANGYLWCRNYGIDCVVIMDGDAQMDPAELESICLPIVTGEADYVKGNRLSHRSSSIMIPRIRYLGNSILSILTKIASGYWQVSDTQTGYTAISFNALNSITLHKIYKTYGVPNDMLVKLNIASCRITEVSIKPVYQIGEKSKMSIARVILPILKLLVISFFKRIWIKYLFREFHPLFLLYHLSFFLACFIFPYGSKIINMIINFNEVPSQTIIAFVFFCFSSFQSLLFAMWMDIQANERLYK